MKKSTLGNLNESALLSGSKMVDMILSTYTSAARHMSEFVPSAVRNNEHSQTYREYRQSIEPTWPEEYMKKAEDYEFDVDAKPWDRY